MYKKREEVIGLLAGGGDLPVVFASNAKKNVIVVGVKGITSEKLKENAKKVYFLNLNEFDKCLDFFQREKVHKIVLLGKFNKDLLFRHLNVFNSFKKILSKLENGQDLSFFKLIDKEAKNRGIQITEPLSYLSHLLVKEKRLTKTFPTKKELEDIKFGWKIAKELANLDIGQTVVVKNSTVIAVEAIEGTDETILRAGRLGGEGNVVVKVARPFQDMRFDIPVVGPTTLMNMAKVKCRVLAIEKEKVILLHKPEVVRIANESKISIVGI